MQQDVVLEIIHCCNSSVNVSQEGPGINTGAFKCQRPWTVFHWTRLTSCSWVAVEINIQTGESHCCHNRSRFHKTILSAELLKKKSNFSKFFCIFFSEKCIKYQNHISEYFGKEYLETILKNWHHFLCILFAYILRYIYNSFESSME